MVNIKVERQGKDRGERGTEGERERGGEEGDGPSKGPYASLQYSAGKQMSPFLDSTHGTSIFSVFL